MFHFLGLGLLGAVEVIRRGILVSFDFELLVQRGMGVRSASCFDQLVLRGEIGCRTGYGYSVVPITITISIK